MKIAATSLEQRFLAFATPWTGTFSMCEAPGMLPIAPNSRLSNMRTLQHRGRPLIILNPCKQRMSGVYALAASTLADNVGTRTSTDDASAQFQQLQDVIIVGGGIAGLATALALHRVGIKPLVLEQAERLRTAGSVIGLWTNAWKALEALGVADSLRKTFVKVSGCDFYDEAGNSILNLGFDEVSRHVELRAVERKVLLKTLQEPLPDGAVLYDSDVTGVRKLAGGYTEVQCKDGNKFQTKVLIGCDGAGSVVARWMNMEEPRFAGYAATRGMAVYPDGHNLSNKAKQIIGRGVRAGIAPIDEKRVYWFVVFNSSGERVTDVELVHKEALNYVKGWPSMITEAINRTPLDTLSRRGITDRWMWPAGGPPLYNRGVTLAGDAMHPMTPNLGQGGCLALEDAIILARALSKVLASSDWQQPTGSPESQLKEMERIDLALKSYTEERWGRVLPISIRSYITGVLLQLDSKFVCSLRNKLLPKVFKPERFVDHTFFDCGALE
ncbi:hypothetical protein L7F22_050884 [Adiantum nelumboides]|nr:hypothetical protein [Adiantum nelumboides]